MIVRQATLADIPRLNSLVNGSYRGEASKKGWTTEAGFLEGIRTNERDLAGMLANPTASILVVQESTELQACVYLEQQPTALYLGMLTVQPHLQARGIGALLLIEAETKAKQLLLTKIIITVISIRHELIAYYQRKGFADTGVRKPFISGEHFGQANQPLEFMIMEKQL